MSTSRPPHLARSDVQQALEMVVIARAAAKLGFEAALVEPRRLAIGNASIQVDGWHAGQPEAALEVFCCAAPLKPGQRNKLRGDMLKLALLRRRMPDLRLVLVVTSEVVASRMRAGWESEVLLEFAIDLVVVELSDDERRQLDEARRRQQLGNRVAPGTERATDIDADENA